MAPIGRWQKGKDILWWTKASEEQKAAEMDEKVFISTNYIIIEKLISICLMP